jgi:hypothetical protein
MNNKILNNSTLPVPVLSPAFVTGLADGEGSFGLYLQKTSKIQTGYQVKYEFTIVLHDRDRALLENVQLEGALARPRFEDPDKPGTPQNFLMG